MEEYNVKTALSTFERVREALLPRYAVKDKRGYIIESWPDIFNRVANFLGDNIMEQDSFFNIMMKHQFLPNSPCLMNANTKYNMLAACFVLDMEDDSESIMNTTHDAVRIQRTGGGVGIPFHKLRPRGALVKTSGGSSSGPVTFLEGMAGLFRAWQQGGRRRGAFMGTLTSDHHDIEEFISVKNDNSKIPNFNISVMMFNEDMSNEYLLEKIARNSWVNGDPAVLFWDRINQNQEHGREIWCTNPCAESPLEPYEACVLGSVNLRQILDYDHLSEVAYDGFVMLNRMIEKSKWPLSRIKETVQKNKKVGLGIMGFHDWLLGKAIVYGSDRSIKEVDLVMGSLMEGALSAVEDYGFKNEARFSIAPTGSISLIADMCSSGIEPYFQREYDRYILDYETNSLNSYRFSHHLKDEDYFVDAHQIPWKKHIDVQAAFQKHVDMSVSKTINVPSSFTIDEIIKVYKYAHQKGLKGVTIYRDQSKKDQPIQKCDGDHCVL